MTAAILTIGDEVSSGQIVNRNAAWLANELEKFKIKVTIHITVCDVESQIIDALKFLESRASLIFTTGGLGPTRDDLTQDAVCKWLEKPSVFDEGSWEKICLRLKDLGIAVSESNRSQCFFPKSSRILVNHAGTANAFYAEKNNGKTKIWCLPGPPFEIKRLWMDHIGSQIESELLEENDERLTLLRWRCLGKSESALGEIVETAISGSSLISGYRAHLPYVEVKLWTPDKDKEKNAPFIKEMEKAIAPWFVSKDDEDIVELLLTEFEKFDIVKVVDYSSQGYLAQKFGTISRSHPHLELSHLTVVSEWDTSDDLDLVFKTLELSDTEELTLVIGPINSLGGWDLGWSFDGDIYRESLSLPFRRGPRGNDRLFNYQGELSIFFWLKELRSRELKLSYN